MTVDDPRGEPDPRRVLEITDEDAGLEAWIAVDAVEDGLTAGGIRRARYGSRAEAIEAAKHLARARTLACRAAEVPSGGAATVIRDHEDLDVARAYRAIGTQIDRMDPTYLCGPDVGTGDPGMDHVSEATDRVPHPHNDADRATAVGVLSGIQAVLWALEGDPRVEGALVLVHGYGSLGRYVANGLADQGAKVRVSDPNPAAREEAEDAGYETIEPETWPEQTCDVFVPCSSEIAVTAEQARSLEARGICGGSHRPLASREAAEVLHKRNVQYAPDVLVNGGGLIEAVLTWREGDSPRVQDEIDRRLSDVYERTRRVLAEAADRDVPPDDVVVDRWG